MLNWLADWEIFPKSADFDNPLVDRLNNFKAEHGYEATVQEIRIMRREILREWIKNQVRLCNSI